MRQLFARVPPALASLSLGLIGLGYAWGLYLPNIAKFIVPSLAGMGAMLLLPVLLKYALNADVFIRDLKNPLTGSLMAPMSMALLVLCDYLAVISPEIAKPVWMASFSLHFSMMVIFFSFQVRRFKMTDIVPSWFLYPVGIISSALAGHKLGYVWLSEWLMDICIALYFILLPIVLYRLVFYSMVPRRARPTLAIMAAPINLTLATYLVNTQSPDPILTGALAGAAVTMTLLIYLCYIRLLQQPFQPPIAAITFPSVISAIAMHHLTNLFGAEYPQWYWLHQFGWFELSLATGLVGWVCWGYLKAHLQGTLLIPPAIQK